MKNETELIIKALENPKHSWRTIEGIAEEVRLPPEKVKEAFETNKEKIYRSLKPRKDGKYLYITREKYRKMFLMKGNQSLKPVTEIAAEISETKPGDIQKIGSLVIELLNKYNQEVLSQAKISFKWAVIVAALGFIIFGGSIIVIFLNKILEIALIGIIGGAITEVIGGLQFYLYGKTMAQLAYFQQSLDRTQRFLIANSICEALEGENKQKSRAELVKLIALSAQTTSNTFSE